MLVFVHINKTAGRTMRYILRSSYGPRHCEVEPWHAAWEGPPFSTSDLRRVRKIYPDLASIAGHRVTGYAELEERGTEFRYFTFLRDPVAMCVSRFQYHVDHRKKKNLVFEEWIQREWLRNAQTKQIAGVSSVDDAIRVMKDKEMFVGLTERFDESLVLLKGLRASDLDIAYTPINVARSRALAEELLTKRSTRQTVIDANQEDVALYEYVANELYPTFQREYGPALDGAVSDHRGASRKFNRRNLAASRLKQYVVYRPLLRLHRSRATGQIVDRLLG